MGEKEIALQQQLAGIYGRYREDYSGTCLVRQGEKTLLAEAAGLANRDFGVPNAMDTRFDTASVTKVFTAVGVLLLIREGKLFFDDRIGEVIDLSGTRIPADVTISHLLTHTSGIADDADEEAGEDYAALFVDKPNYSIRRTADFLPQFAHKEPVFPAGTGVRYNNCAFVLLGLALEERTGMAYRDYITQHVFRPLGMEHTCFYAKDEVCPEAAEGYFQVEGDDGTGGGVWKKNIYSFPPVGSPDGGAYTTVEDLDRFLRGLRAGKLLGEEYARLLFRPHSPFPKGHEAGVWRTGYAFEFLEAGGQVFCMFKDGWNPGVEAMCAFFPALDVTVSLLANTNGRLYRLFGELRKALREHHMKACGL